MENYKLLMVEEGEADLEKVKRVYRDTQFNVVGVTADGNEAIELIDKFKPDIIVCGLVLSGVDGFEVLKYIASQKLNTKIVVLTAVKNDVIIKRAMDFGALYYMTKPVSMAILKDRLLGLCREEENQLTIKAEEKPIISLDERISKIFISVGIPPHIKGYAYLREGVKMAVDNPQIINSITKKLYPMIGDKYDTSASKVERAIRHAIEVAWNRNRIESINSVFGVRAYVGSEKPTNGEFIALVADKMLLEGA